MTSQRHDVATSQHQREICPPSLKAKGVQNLGGSENEGSYELGHGNQSSSDIDLDKAPVIFIFSAFSWIVILMFEMLLIRVLLFSMF